MFTIPSPTTGWAPLGRALEVLVRHGFGALTDRLEQRVHLKPPSDSSPTAAHLRRALEELGPVAVKFGQQLSTRPDIVPPDWARELAKLQDAVPPARWEEVKALLETELGRPIEEVFEDFDPVPFAAASLAQVHAARLHDDGEVVVKVQRPGITPRVEEDLEVLARVARMAQQRLELGKVYDFPAMAEEFADAVRAELDYRREGQNIDRFRVLFHDEPRLRLPRVIWSLSSRRVLVMERLRGIKVDDLAALDAARVDRHQVALDATKMIVREVLETGLFHADPHPGNLFVLERGVLGVVDFGRVGRLSQETRTHLTRFYISLLDSDVEAIIEELERLGAFAGEPDRGRLERDIRRLVERYTGTRLEDVSVSQVWGDIFTLARRHQLRLPSDLVLLSQTLTMIEGVGLMLDPKFDTFAVSRPLVADLRTRLWWPETWWPELRRTARDVLELFARSPRGLRKALDRLERGQFALKLEAPDLERFASRLDQISNRLVIGMILTGFVVALGFVIPSLERSQSGSVLSQLALAGFAGAGLLGAWLIWRIWTSDHSRRGR